MNHYYCGKKNSLKVFGIVLFLALFSPCVVNASDEMVKEEKKEMAIKLVGDAAEVEGGS